MWIKLKSKFNFCSQMKHHPAFGFLIGNSLLPVVFYGEVIYKREIQWTFVSCAFSFWRRWLTQWLQPRGHHSQRKQRWWWLFSRIHLLKRMWVMNKNSIHTVIFHNISNVVIAWVQAQWVVISSKIAINTPVCSPAIFHDEK